jgi:hypothetical protein
MLALVKTSSLICPYARVQPMFRQCLFEELKKWLFATWIATTPGISLFALVGADKDMFMELRHEFP